MRCLLCNDILSSDDGPVLCEDCSAAGFVVKVGTVVCPTCGGDFKRCECSAPDSAIM